MKNLGKYIMIIGSLAAIIIPPYRVLNSLNWGLIWENVVSIKGLMSAGQIYNYIDYKILLIELVVINLVGILLITVAPKSAKDAEDKLINLFIKLLKQFIGS